MTFDGELTIRDEAIPSDMAVPKVRLSAWTLWVNPANTFDDVRDVATFDHNIDDDDDGPFTSWTLDSCFTRSTLIKDMKFTGTS